MSFVGQKSRQLLLQCEGADTRSQSSKELEDVETEMSGLPSQRNFNFFEDQYQLGQSRESICDPKENRKNHIFIKMSARINGVEFSPDNTKPTKVYETYQQNLKTSSVFKKLQEKSINKSKAFQKIVQKEAEISRLQQQNKRLSVANQQLKGNNEQRKFIKSTDRFFPSFTTSQEGIRVYKRDQNYFSLADKLELEEKLSKAQQIKIYLQKKIIQIQSILVQKEKAIKDIMKQSQHEINLLYQNLSKRLKAKEVESYMNGKHLKQEQQKVVSLTSELSKITQQKSLLNIVINNHLKQKQQLLVTLRDFQDQVRKSKIVAMRLQHTQNQLKYLNEQLKTVKKEKQQAQTEARITKAQLIKVKKQFSDIVAKSNNSNFAQIVFLRQSLIVKQEEIQKIQAETIKNSKLQRELIAMAKKADDSNELLTEANQKILKLMLENFDKTISKKNF